MPFTLLAAALVVAAACDDGARRSAQAEARAKAEAEAARERSEAQARLESSRLAALWSYVEVPAGKGRQLTASIRSSDPVDTGGGEPHPVLLVFRDHPAWGRSSYLVLEAGDFNCGKCRVTVLADGAANVIAAHRPRSNEAIAIFIDDARALWTLATKARQLQIEFPARGGTRTAAFDVGGLDPAKMPGW